MKRTCRTTLLALASAAIASQIQPASAEELTVMATGGAWQAALKQAWFEPFAKKMGVTFNEQEYTGELGKIKAMVETGDVPIDLVTVETSTVLQGCDDGVLIRLDYSKIADRSKFLPGTALDCGVGIDVYGDVLAYDTTVLKEAPTSVLDIFDTKKFPGKRAMRKAPAQNLEWALMADGVPVADVYKVLGDARGRRPRLQETRHDQEGHRLVGCGRAAAATPRLQGSGDDDRLERAHSKRDRPRQAALRDRLERSDRRI